MEHHSWNMAVESSGTSPTTTTSEQSRTSWRPLLGRRQLLLTITLSRVPDNINGHEKRTGQHTRTTERHEKNKLKTALANDLWSTWCEKG